MQWLEANESSRPDADAQTGQVASEADKSITSSAEISTAEEEGLSIVANKPVKKETQTPEVGPVVPAELEEAWLQEFKLEFNPDAKHPIVTLGGSDKQQKADAEA